MTPSTSRAHSWLIVTAVLTVLAVGLSPQPSRSQTDGDGPALPTSVAVIEVDAAEDHVYRIGIPDLLGESSTMGEVMRNDFQLMPGYRVIDPRSVHHDLVAEGLAVRSGAWAGLGAHGVIKGEVRAVEGGLEVELRFYRVARAAEPAFTRTYRGLATRSRAWAHDFANEVLRVLTGMPGSFGTEIAYARRIGPGRKDVFRAQMDGYGEHRVSSVEGISLLPTFGNRRIYFTRMTTRGMFITHGRARDARIVDGDGINMAPAICDGRIYFTSSRDGNSEIYSTDLDGGDLQRLTNHPAMDLSPSCGPNGKLAFVSSRHRTPQVFTMNRDGSDVRRVTFRGNHNQTPTWCQDPARPWIAFTGRDGNYDIFMVNTVTQDYVRLTQGQGDNKDPAFSPDCRLVAFASDRRGAPGIYLSSTQGFNQNRVVQGDAETVRWRQWDGPYENMSVSDPVLDVLPTEPSEPTADATDATPPAP
ncbi:MAG: PD40 domain-containing protein [Sandaracinaceae bacterium]|nr:PD40 domain-containing protein [Sandaracinaceae bacterium]